MYILQCLSNEETINGPDERRRNTKTTVQKGNYRNKRTIQSSVSTSTYLFSLPNTKSIFLFGSRHKLAELIFQFNGSGQKNKNNLSIFGDTKSPNDEECENQGQKLRME